MMRQFNPKRALISVNDKSQLVPFAQKLHKLGIDILSTGGTSQLLRQNQVPTTEIGTYTGAEEIFDGRVKTLHPKIHGGLLYDRNNESHVSLAHERGIAPIDIVVCNLYNFAGEAVEKQLSFEDAIEHIDIGGPTMLRAGAKNFAHIAVLSDPSDYDEFVERLESDQCNLEYRRQLATKVFAKISQYDQMIAQYFGPEKQQTLRYGENPHQTAHFVPGASSFSQLAGKELSYNNLVDLDACYQTVLELKGPGAVICKHTNPCGMAQDRDLHSALEAAFAADNKSAFGGIVALNRTCDEQTATFLTTFFCECVIAPEFSEGAIQILKEKKNLRIVQAAPNLFDPWQSKSALGGVLIQSADKIDLFSEAAHWQLSTKVESQYSPEDWAFAMVAAKHTKSNAITICQKTDHGIRSIGVGAGQMSRVDATEIAIKKAQEFGHDLKGALLASDAFFPFDDCVRLAGAAGIQTIVQPGGSKRDQESIDAANELNLAMILTGKRHFKH